MQVPRRDVKRILFQNRKIRKVPRRYPALDLLLKGGFGSMHGEGVERFRHAEGLLRQIRSGSVEARPRHGAFNALHDIRQFHRTVGSVGDAEPGIQERFPSVTGVREFPPRSCFHDSFI